MGRVNGGGSNEHSSHVGRVPLGPQERRLGATVRGDRDGKGRGPGQVEAGGDQEDDEERQAEGEPHPAAAR
jgi:hypothetical protein